VSQQPGKQAAQPISQCERAPDFSCPTSAPSSRSLYDKVKGGPIVLLFYPTRRDPGSAAQLQKFRNLAASIQVAGAHLFAIGGDAVDVAREVATRYKADFSCLPTPTTR
jgi:peroxiredoxin Q/BCP